jgi:hypothetical protein
LLQRQVEGAVWVKVLLGLEMRDERVDRRVRLIHLELLLA